MCSLAWVQTPVLWARPAKPCGELAQPALADLPGLSWSCSLLCSSHAAFWRPGDWNEVNLFPYLKITPAAVGSKLLITRMAPSPLRGLLEAVPPGSWQGTPWSWESTFFSYRWENKGPGGTLWPVRGTDCLTGLSLRWALCSKIKEPWDMAPSQCEPSGTSHCSCSGLASDETHMCVWDSLCNRYKNILQYYYI